VQSMPELPEVEALTADLRERVVGHSIERVEVAAISALKTFDPPPTALHGAKVTGTGRFGKFLDLIAAPQQGDELHLVVHLARAGWLHYRDALPVAPLKPGKGPIALRVRLDDGGGFDLTEQGTQKKLAVYLVRDPRLVPGVAKLGPDALTADEQTFAQRIRSRRGQLKGVLTDQEVLAGIGNAYSDEILHRAKLSPFAISDRLSEEAMTALFDATRSALKDAVDRSMGQGAASLKGEKKSGLMVHNRTGLPCPVCGDVIREVSFADSSMQYCPTCQTGGKPLADRRTSKFLR
jgi:formamidopyrimidine-DNA glycosylase